MQTIFFTSGIRSLLQTSTGHGEVRSRSKDKVPARTQESLKRTRES